MILGRRTNDPHSVLITLHEAHSPKWGALRGCPPHQGVVRDAERGSRSGGAVPPRPYMVRSIRFWRPSSSRRLPGARKSKSPC